MCLLFYTKSLFDYKFKSFIGKESTHCNATLCFDLDGYIYLQEQKKLFASKESSKCRG